MEEGFALEMGRMAVEAMLFEVSCTPKPGLVDRNNSGAHRDMDFFTFLSSTAALSTTFGGLARLGTGLQQASPQQALCVMQEHGRAAEEAMFRATGGINTHKGMIFSLGLVCGGAGRLYGREPLTAEAVCREVAILCNRLCDRSYQDLAGKEILTKGERAYLDHGLKGVRGEAESGFATVRDHAYPVLVRLMEGGRPVNDALVHSLLHLIAAAEDTNVVARRGLEAAAYARDCARQALDRGGMLSPEGRASVEEMDRDFIARNISPGGCADLLAVTWLLYSMEKLYGAA